MLDSIRETRMVEGGMYKLVLEIPEDSYWNFYGDIEEEYAEDILNQYLQFRQDDGKPQEVAIEHDAYNHIINIKANLHYLGNEYTAQEYYNDDTIHGTD